MKRLLLLALVVIVAAGLLGTLVARDPGYALLVYGDYAMQTSLWILLSILALAGLALYGAASLYRALRGVGGGFKAWRAGYRASRSSRLRESGLALLLEGEYRQARRHLDEDLDDSFTRGVNFLAAARAADEEAKPKDRERYLRLAVEAAPALARARQVIAGELALQRGDHAACLKALVGLAANPHIDALRQAALQQSGDWRGLLEHAGTLHGQESLACQKRAALAGMAALAGDDPELEALYDSLRRDNQRDPEVLQAFGAGLAASDAAEAPVRAALKRAWQPELARLYGSLPGDPAKRLRQAEAWLADRGDDPALRLTIARLHHQAGDATQALAQAQRSLALDPSPDAHRLLAALLEQSGDQAHALQHLKAASAN